MKTRSPVETTPASVSVAGQERFDEVQAASIQPVIRSMPNVEMGGGPQYARATLRLGFKSGFRASDFGFRVVRSLD